MAETYRLQSAVGPRVRLVVVQQPLQNPSDIITAPLSALPYRLLSPPHGIELWINIDTGMARRHDEGHQSSQQR